MSTVPEAIEADPTLTPEQKLALRNVYDSFVATAAEPTFVSVPGMPTRSVEFATLMRRVAVISLHTSPLLQPGSGDSGGMNVYVREMVSSLAQAGRRVHHLHAVPTASACRARCSSSPTTPWCTSRPGRTTSRRRRCPTCSTTFTAGVLDHIAANGGVDVVHANYWLSGVVAHRIKHALDIPFVSTFHTLARVKAEGGDPEPGWRDTTEAELINCADAICVSCVEEEQQFRRLYGDPRGRIEIVAPGVEHAFFAPGERSGARAAIDVPVDVPVILFVGRIQPLKGPDVAIRALHELGRAGRAAADRGWRQRRRR